MHAAIDEIASSGNSFLVAVRLDPAGRIRALTDIPVPQRHAALFTEIPEDRFRVDTSSSEIRASDRGDRPAVPHLACSPGHALIAQGNRPGESHKGNHPGNAQPLWRTTIMNRLLNGVAIAALCALATPALAQLTSPMSRARCRKARHRRLPNQAPAPACPCSGGARSGGIGGKEAGCIAHRHRAASSDTNGAGKPDTSAANQLTQQLNQQEVQRVQSMGAPSTPMPPGPSSAPMPPPEPMPTGPRPSPMR